jgi:hypothetical protein
MLEISNKKGTVHLKSFFYSFGCLSNPGSSTIAALEEEMQ